MYSEVLHFVLADCSEGGLVSIGNVEEAVLVLSLFVHLRHQGVSLQHVASIYEKVKRVFLGQLDALADNIAEVIGSQVVGHQVSGH